MIEGFSSLSPSLTSPWCSPDLHRSSVLAFLTSHLSVISVFFSQQRRYFITWFSWILNFYFTTSYPFGVGRNHNLIQNVSWAFCALILFMCYSFPLCFHVFFNEHIRFVSRITHSDHHRILPYITVLMLHPLYATFVVNIHLNLRIEARPCNFEFGEVNMDDDESFSDAFPHVWATRKYIWSPFELTSSAFFIYFSCSYTYSLHDIPMAYKRFS